MLRTFRLKQSLSTIWKKNVGTAGISKRLLRYLWKSPKPEKMDLLMGNTLVLGQLKIIL